MDNPFFSVIILTYNRPVFLKQAIQSVLDQTYKNFELIIIDDHSTDDTKDVVALYSDKCIKYFLNERSKGQAGARNTGLSHATGEWITFLDDDDIWLPLKLEKQYQKICEVDNDVGFVYTGYATYDFDRKEELTVFIPEKEGWLQQKLLYNNYVGAICTVAIRRRLFKKAGGFDERFQSMVDIEMWIRVAEFTKFVYIKDKLVYIRVLNLDRISLNSKRKLIGGLQIWEKHNNLINKNHRLHHRAASRVFVYAFQESNKEYILKSLPWTFAGLLIDPANIIWVLRNILPFVKPIAMIVIPVKKGVRRLLTRIK